MHYERLRRTGTVDRPPRPTCSVDGCPNKIQGLGWCSMHYQRAKKYGSPLAEVPRRTATEGCAVDGCTNPHSGKGLCSFHYRQEPSVHQRMKQRRRAVQTPEWYRRRRYGITDEEWQAIFDRQESRCLVCRNEEPRGGQWVIHHDHRCCPTQQTCGRCVVGILCRLCNAGMGCLGDNPQWLFRAAAVASMVVLSGGGNGVTILHPDGQREAV